MELVHIFHIQCSVVQFPLIYSSIVFLNEWKMESKSILEPSSSNINPGHSSMSWNFQFRIKTIIRQRLIVSVWWKLETTQTVGLIITLMPKRLYTRNEEADPTTLWLSVSNGMRAASKFHNATQVKVYRQVCLSCILSFCLNTVKHGLGLIENVIFLIVCH